MLSDKLKFTKTLKFKLTFWYSTLLSVFLILFVLSVNLWLDNYMKTNIATVNRGYWGRVIEERPKYRNLTEEQIDLITEARLADLNTIKTVTLYSIIPLVFLSFLGGYGIASFSLKPLEDLSKKMKEKSTENLDEEIQFIDNQDEISELIKSFNRMSRRLNKSFEAQKEFVENASHELKTPLSIIQANLDTALEDKEIDEEELRGLLESSKESIHFMNQLTEDLLLLSVLDQKVQTEKIEIVEVLEKCVKNINSLFPKSEIEIIKNFPNKEVYIKGNSILLERAIMNILENSVKYSEANTIEISLKERRKRVQIIIKDNGVGIPKEQVEKVFERFYRVDKSRSRDTGGAGLGLSITKTIINKFDGEITLESERGKGVKFTIFFPSYLK
jgi:signal transduction histidine kinase